MRRAILSVLCVAVFLPFRSYAARFDIGRISDQAQDVSLVQLIANPAQWQGKVIRVTGVLCLQFEGDSLYLSRDDYKNGVTKNAIWIDFNPDEFGLKENDAKSIRILKALKNLIGKYVFVEGTFDGNQRGHLGLYSGELHVTRIATH